MPLIARQLCSGALLILAATAATAARAPAVQPTLWADRPDVAAFETLENRRLDAARHAVGRLLAVRGPRTIANTLVPYDRAIQQLNSAYYFAQLMLQVHPDAAFRDHATAMTTKASGEATTLSLNHKVYAALARLDVSRADAATRYYVERTLLEFRLAGVNKDDATRAKLKTLQDQLTTEQSTFDRNISDDVRTVIVSDPAELDGLPPDYIDAHKPGADGRIRITTTYPDYGPVTSFAKSDRLRRELYDAFQSRAYPKNGDVLREMMQTRFEIAQLLGYDSWADYNAADKMIGNGRHIAAFIEQLGQTSRPLADRELAMLLAEKRKADPGATAVVSYEYRRLTELVRRSQFDFDSQSVRPYFPYERVKDGILRTAASLFHVSFRQEAGAPGWDPMVETWDVIENGRMIGRFYLDMHPRPGKYSHAEMAAVLDGIRGVQLPEAVLVCNFPAPTATDPGLMTFGDVTTFFHEFGHLVHHILGGRQRWAGIAGISMEADFAEAPSQMLERFIASPQVLASFARHYQTGEVIPADLVARMNRATAFGRASWVAFQTSYAAMSYDVYKAAPQSVDLEAMTLADTRRFSGLVTVPSDAQVFAAFGHLAGYSSMYYTYMWDLVIAADFFQQFDQADLLAGETPMRYRRVVLEPGGSMSANDLVKNFLGRPQSLQAFEEWMGEEFTRDGTSARPRSP